ncbi:MAG: ribonuclease P protein component [Chloroflexi bacterium]|nr:ribonuclease P protein component [Chloroflexota bacterium]MCY4248311.1 ribonuclease P protein component [Chloroflexota bacterium]
MKRALRLRRPADFSRVRRKGRVYRHRLLLLRLCENSLTHNRYGIVTSRRLGLAVERNRIKRRLRELLAALHKELRQGFDIVLLPRRGVLLQPFPELQRIVRQLVLQTQLV